MRGLILALSCTVWLHAQPIEPVPVREADANALNNALKWTGESWFERPVLWHVWPIAIQGKPQLAALFVTATIFKPGESAACLLFFDQLASRPARNQCFSTGGRIEPAAARMHYSSNFGTHILTLDMSHSVTFTDGRKVFFSDVAKEHFAIGDRGARLIRVENDDGQAIANRSHIGPAAEILSAEQIAAVLSGPDVPAMLEALQFLATPAGERFRYHKEPWTQVGKLAKESPQEWVRDAARVALESRP